EGQGDPLDHLSLDDEPDPVLRREDAVGDREGRADRMLDRIVRLRADERVAAGVDDQDDVSRSLALVFVREEALESRGRLPVDPPHLVARDVFADAPEVGPRADPAGGDLPEPRSGPPRLERRAAQVLHRRRDDEGGTQVYDGILRAEGERIEGPRPDRPEDEISFDRRPDRVRKAEGPPSSRDTTAWCVPRTTTNSRGRTSAISTRSREAPSFRTRSSTSTS